MSVQIKDFVVGLVTPGFFMYKLIYCIHLHIHMCIVYKVLFLFFLCSYIHNVYFRFLIKHSYLTVIIETFIY